MLLAKLIGTTSSEAFIYWSYVYGVPAGTGGMAHQTGWVLSCDVMHRHVHVEHNLNVA